MKTIKKIAILCSGGDAPGMNACIRAITLTALVNNLDAIGIHNGFNGLLADESQVLSEACVRQIIHRGGTILKTGRCKNFSEHSAAKKAAQVLERHQIDALFIIGGNGSFHGAIHLSQHWLGQILGLPGTIDNDIDGTDATIGYYTAMSTALSAIDKIRDTADAFERIFVVEIMGRHSSFLTLNVGIACGAEQIICHESYPHSSADLDAIAGQVKHALNSHHDSSYIIVLMENYWPGGATGLAEQLSQCLKVECRPCILGHIQRGGSPVSVDRILATKLGVAAVEAALSGEHLVMLGQTSGQVSIYPLAQAVLQNKIVDPFLLDIQQRVFDAR